MIIHNVEQGTEEWFKVRCGIFTASRFDKIITPTGKESTQAEDYINELAYELVTGNKVEIETTEYMARGSELEPEAAGYYNFINADVSTCGFITDDHGRWGCSPDRLVGDCGLLEIKCPKPSNHIKNLKNGFDNKYKPQVQGQLFITGRDWCDFMSYCPGVEPLIVRIGRDENFIKELERLLTVAHERKLETCQLLTKQ